MKTKERTMPKKPSEKKPSKQYPSGSPKNQSLERLELRCSELARAVNSLSNTVADMCNQVISLEGIVAAQKPLVDHMFLELQVRGILSNVTQASNPLRFPLINKNPSGTPIPTRDSVFKVPSNPPKEAPKVIEKL